MSNAIDMSTPVTRGELREEIDRLDARITELSDRMTAEMATMATTMATKTELEMWGGALLKRIESGEQRLIERITATERQLQTDLARHANALHEAMAKMVSGIDDKYSDLPRRVSRLEGTVFRTRRR
jgi:hypothetical protein